MDNQNNIEEPKKKKGPLFFRWLTRDGKGVDKDDTIKIDDYNAKNFFKLFGRRIRYIININWLYIFGNFPLLTLLLAISGNFSHAATAPQSQFYPVVYGIQTITGTTPSLMNMIGVHGVMGTATAYSWIDYVLFGISALLLVTFGLVNTGCAYLIRNLVRGEHLFLWDDFKSAIRQNWKQGLVLGIFDTVVLGLSAYSIYFYIVNYQTYYILFFASLIMMMLYLFMRFYMYTLLVTFELSVWKIIKNSFLFAMIGLGKNFLALLCILLVLGVTFMLSTLFMPIGIIILFMFLVSTTVYISTYFTYPKIKQVMIDPYYSSDKPEEDGEPAE